MVKRVTFSGVLLAGLLMQVGCVTEIEEPVFQKSDPQRFTEVSIAAAAEYIKEGNAETAFKHLKRALEKAPKSPEAHNAMALVYRLTGDKKLEEKHFKLSLRYDSTLSKARNNYATFLYNENRYKEALKQLKKAANDPGYENRAVAFENMGRCYLKLADLEKAEEAFLSATRADGRMSRSYLELADIAFKKNDRQGAADYVEQYGLLARHTPRSLWLGIQVQRVVGDRDKLASYELALRKLYPNSAEYQAYIQSE